MLRVCRCLRPYKGDSLGAGAAKEKERAEKAALRPHAILLTAVTAALVQAWQLLCSVCARTEQHAWRHHAPTLPPPLHGPQVTLAL